MFCTGLGLQMLPLLVQNGMISSVLYPALAVLLVVVALLVWLSRRLAPKGVTILLCLVTFFGLAAVGLWFEYRCEVAGSAFPQSASADAEAALQGYFIVLGPAVLALAAASAGIVLGLIAPIRRHRTITSQP